MFQKSKGCSQCCEGTLVMKDAAREETIAGAPESEAQACAFYECDQCGFSVKEYENGRVELAGHDEWNRSGE